MTEKPESLNKVKSIIAIASGKGGVGKSTITANLAVTLAKMGKKVGIIDADVFGPSIPKMLGVEDEAPLVKSPGGKDMIIPVENYSLKILSIGFFVDKNNPVIWRGPMASNFLKQLISESDWGELDFMLVDLPPGTSDIHLTLVQTVPVSGVVIVCTPQEVAVADARKGIGMFRSEKINIPILGIVENMSWFTPAELPDNKYYIFGKDGGKRLAEEQDVPLLGQVPIMLAIREDSDTGMPSSMKHEAVTEIFNGICKKLGEQLSIHQFKVDTTRLIN